MAKSFLVFVFLNFFIYFASTFPIGNVTEVCIELARKISNDSTVLYQSNINFTSDIHHWFSSSSQVPARILEVGSAEDTSIALQVIGRTRTSFAVESGGHASNPGFSSTTGVHISLKRLNQVSLSGDKSTVTIGMSQTWAEVYEILDGSGVNVVGGRTPGPGVGGFSLGGGFSWKTNQYGLTCDTIKSFTLVLPNGTASTVDSSQSDLFFALKGGLNRFGIVTSAVFSTHQQSDLIYGGFNLYSSDQTEAILNATTKFYRENTDPKAQIISTLSGSLLGTTALVLFFYDGPTAPASYDIEPFLSSYGNKSTESAYPHAESPLPLNVYFAWALEVEDSFWYSAMRASVQRLVEVAKQEGIYVDTRYPNYAATGTSAALLYGLANARRLSSIRDQIDPDRAMNLAGGFDI